MTYASDAAARDWDHEVAGEQVRLIEAGIPPWEAAIRAAGIVRRRRERAARQKRAEGWPDDRP